MKRLSKILILLMVLAVCLSFPLTAHAHPGKTDGNGGHTDHDTGEYHYHHGYPAHSHYDMDGDGTIDCPYDFDDKTGVNSGSNSGSISISNNDRSTKSPALEYKTQTESSSKGKKEVTVMPDWVYWIIGILGAIVFICFWLIKAKNQEIHDIRKQYNTYASRTRSLLVASVNRQYNQTLDSIAREQQKMLESLPSSAKVNFRDPFPLDFYEEYDNSTFPFDLPYGVTITKTGEAALGHITTEEPFGKYTVYTTYSGHCYHRSRFCKYITLSFPTCIFTAARGKTPCSFCHPPSMSSIPKWYLNFLSASKLYDINWKESQQ